MEKDYEVEIERLKEIIGSWRRKAQDKKSRRSKPFREGFKMSIHGHEHYKLYIIDSIPGDLPMMDVLMELRNGFLKTVRPYRFSRCDYSVKYDAWIVEVYKIIEEIDMSVD